MAGVLAPAYSSAAMPAAAWIVPPLLGAAIGYLTNRLAVRMIFRPIRPVRILGLRLQGLIGRRQGELATRIGQVVGDHLVQHEDLARALRQIDLERFLGDALERGLAPRLAELRRAPFVGSFLSDERVARWKQSLVRGLVEDEEALVRGLEEALESGLDVRDLVARRVEAFPVERLEALVLDVASRELRAIELLGGLLGFLIGVVQAVVLVSS